MIWGIQTMQLFVTTHYCSGFSYLFQINSPGMAGNQNVGTYVLIE